LLENHKIGNTVLPALIKGVHVRGSVARWLPPKPAKPRHEKLLDPARNHVTNFQLKSA